MPLSEFFKQYANTPIELRETSLENGWNLVDIYTELQGITSQQRLFLELANQAFKFLKEKKMNYYDVPHNQTFKYKIPVKVLTGAYVPFYNQEQLSKKITHLGYMVDGIAP